MTLKAWLSSNNISHEKSKPICNLREPPSKGWCSPHAVCGGLKLRSTDRSWRTKSVEDRLGVAEQGDYGFIEYFSMRRGNARNFAVDPCPAPSPYDTWNQFQSSWNQGPDWLNCSPAQFYPGTLNRQETASRKRSKRERPHSLHQEVQRQESLFQLEDVRTSTPLASPSFRHNQRGAERQYDKSKTSTGILKRNSVLSKLRPDRWNRKDPLDGSLRRCLSKDDVLSSPKSGSICASQPDLLLSHTSSDMSPAPISILPPTCRNAAANVTQTLPRRRRSSNTNKENTLLARGKRWFVGIPNKENEQRNRRGHDRLTSLVESSPVIPFLENVPLDGSHLSSTNNAIGNLYSDNRKLKVTTNHEKLQPNPYHRQEKHPLERLRCRRPLTFYLLEDYLSPVRGTSGGVELDEFLSKAQPRVLFNECPKRPLPPTPEWDSPSLSPPSSLVSALSGVTPLSTEEGLNLVDSPEKVHKTPSSGSSEYTRFVTPEQSIPDHKTAWFSSTSHLTNSPHQSGISTLPKPELEHRSQNGGHFFLGPSSGSSHFGSVTHNHSNSFSYPHSHANPLSHSRMNGSVSNLHTLRNSSNNQQPQMPNLFPRDMTASHQRDGTHAREGQCQIRRGNHVKDRRMKNGDFKWKNPGQQKEALQRLGRSGNSGPKNQLPCRIRQNGLIANQKLPALSNNNHCSSSSSLVNAPIDGTRAAEGDSFFSIPSSRLPSVVNNNKGEIVPSDLIITEGAKANRNLEDSSTDRNPGASEPLRPQDVLRLCGDRLTAYERKEIESYPTIWYLGLDAKKIHGEEGTHLNGGFDDENGSYNKVMHDHISYRYEILEVIGKGSFGQVIRAIDHKTGEQVAIKIIRNKKRFHHQALVEVKILDHLRKRDRDHFHNIIHMLDYFYFRNHLCITFELLGLNLYELIKKNNYQGFGLGLIKRFAYSLVQCLRLLARENIIHCDLKPENVLLKERADTSIRVIDFGSSCYSHQRVYTYIQSRFYRSPEVILGLPYGLSIDMWSLGCILAELYTGYPLFPGENEVEQLACIMESLGLPPQYLLMNASRRRLFFDSKGSPRCITNSKGKKRRPGSRDIASMLKCPDSPFENFIIRCLDWDPSNRITPDEALQHEWLLSSSASTTPLLSLSSSVERKVNGTGSIYRRPVPPTGSTGSTRASSDAESNQSRESKNKRDSSLGRMQGCGGTSRNREGDPSPSRNREGGSSPSSDTVNANHINNSCSRSSKESDTKEKDEGAGSAPGIHDPGSENSLDDSGTFLPPIL